MQKQKTVQISEAAVRSCIGRLRLMRHFPGGNDRDVMLGLAAEIVDACAQAGADDDALAKITANFVRHSDEWPGVASLRLAINPPKREQSFDVSIYDAPPLTDAEREAMRQEIEAVVKRIEARRK